ncbi:MAG: tetratricopeptide repeat protein [Rhodospirillales bacterium]
MKFLSSLAVVVSVGLMLSGTTVLAGFDEGEIAYSKRDYKTALTEWRPLAESGNPEAQYKIGMMYRRGLGVKPDYHQSAEWLLKAARKGHGLAQARLSRLLQDGKGIPQDLIEAYKWLTLAVRNENPALEPVLLEMRDRLTAAEIQEAEARANRWKPEP